MKTVLQLVTLFVLLFPRVSFSQSPAGVIKGTVLTADGEPANGVTIELKKFRRLTIADARGAFTLQHLPKLSDSLVITSLGATLYAMRISLLPGETVNIGTVRLTTNIKLLQTVETNGRAAESYKSDYSFFGEKTETAVRDIPQSISAVTKEMIHDKMELTLKDAVSDVAGVNQYSGYDEYTIRGFRAENARDINGLRGYNTTYTSSMLVNIDRVEVIKGPTAALYGNCDPGGTINMVTKKPLDHTAAELNLFGGSWNHFRAAGDVTGALNSSKTLLYRLNAGYDQKKSFRDQIHAKSYQVAPSFTFIPNNKIKINFDFSLSHTTTVLDRGQPGLDSNNALNATPVNLSFSQPGNYLKETDIASVLTFAYKINNRLSFNVGYLRYNTTQQVAEHGFHDYITPDSVSLYYSTWNYKTVTHTLTNYFSYMANTWVISHKFLLGYDFVKSNVTLNQQHLENPVLFGVGSGVVGAFSLTSPRYNQLAPGTYRPSDFENDASDVDPDIYHTQGIYVQDEMNFKRWKILASLREEFYKGDNSDSAGQMSEQVFLPRIGIVYALTPNVNIYATYNKGFDPFEASTAAQVFNQPFKPIVSELYEAGFKGDFLQNKFAASLSFYRLTVENVATNAEDPLNPNLFVQQGQNRSKGIEAEATGTILPNLSVLVSYAYDVATVTQDKDPSIVGSNVANAPRNSSSSWIKYAFKKNNNKGLGISVGHSFVGNRATLDPHIHLPSYFLLNGGVSYVFKKISLAMILNNITNKTYWIGAYDNINKWPGAPRNFMISLGFKL